MATSHSSPPTPVSGWDQTLANLQGTTPTEMQAAAAQKKKAKTAELLAHWHKDFDGFPTSPKEFYGAVERQVERWQLPGVERSRVDWHESGIFSAKREYLRVSRGKLTYDICAAPFGGGFFVSSWMAELRSPYGPLALFFVMAGLLVVLLVSLSQFGLLTGVIVFVLAVPVLLYLLAQFAQTQTEGWDDALVAMPVLGALYERLFRPETYYKTDTRLLFQSAIHSSVLGAIQDVTKGEGLRGLSELERKPVMRDFFGKK